MAAAVVRFTKSVAERPHKQMVQGHAGALFSFCSDKAMTSVKPNSVGEGLLKGELFSFGICTRSRASACGLLVRFWVAAG